MIQLLMVVAIIAIATYFYITGDTKKQKNPSPLNPVARIEQVNREIVIAQDPGANTPAPTPGSAGQSIRAPINRAREVVKQVEERNRGNQ